MIYEVTNNGKPTNQDVEAATYREAVKKACDILGVTGPSRLLVDVIEKAGKKPEEDRHG